MAYRDDPTAEPVAMPSPIQLVVVTVVLVAAVTLARGVFIPVAMAVLLSFVLNPLVHGLKRLRFGRIVSVLFAVSISVVMLAGLGLVMRDAAAAISGRKPASAGSAAARQVALISSAGDLPDARIAVGQ